MEIDMVSHILLFLSRLSLILPLEDLIYINIQMEQELDICLVRMLLLRLLLLRCTIL
nr:MAG TPA: hypothetical protein [Bacteriophage sp.]